MKKLVKILAVCLVLLQVGASACAITVDEVEEKFGTDISSADAVKLKEALLYFDIVMEYNLQPLDQYRAKIISRLRDLGETEWVTIYLGKNGRSEEVLGLSYDDLIDLKNDINLAMWLSAEWQEVKVPQGTWKVGEDIPAGHWTVKCAPDAMFAEIAWGEKVSENGEDISYGGRNSRYNKVYGSERFDKDDDRLFEYSFEVKDGDYIQIKYASVIFMPYVGKPSFGFR